jgi:ATP-dependent Lon protease
MTGEVTLRGRILEIGGVKEKTLAAYRAGLRQVILPSGNEKDLRDVPDDVRQGMTFHFVDQMDEVIEIALLERGVRQERKKSPRARGSAAPRTRVAAEGEGTDKAGPNAGEA